MQQPMPNASPLAFLSACETAMGDKNLPDDSEAIHIGAVLVSKESSQLCMW